MNVETQRKNIVHRILDIENSQLLDQIEDILNNDIYCFTATGKPLNAREYKNHLTKIMTVSEIDQTGYSTSEARKKIIRK